MPPLEREEYIEQAYLYRALLERIPDAVPLQDLLAFLRQEILSTTKLPLAIDFMLTELKHSGLMSAAMKRLDHYFHPFQSYLVTEAEAERGRFDMRLALQILQHEADYRAKGGTAAGLFLYQFECLCRSRLKYDEGLRCMALDPWYNSDWREWILIVRRQVGLVDFAEMIFARSEFALQRLQQRGYDVSAVPHAILFGEKEGKIAFANREKDPLYLFSALQRQLGYPPVPRGKKQQEFGELLTLLQQKIERMEVRLKLLEEEQRGGIDLNKLYVHTNLDFKASDDLPSYQMPIDELPPHDESVN
jgi:hypothetical protein